MNSGGGFLQVGSVWKGSSVLFLFPSHPLLPPPFGVYRQVPTEFYRTQVPLIHPIYFGKQSCLNLSINLIFTFLSFDLVPQVAANTDQR